MTEKTDEGMYPGAHPTAPGGMSRANLRLELAEYHGVKMDDSRDIKWPDLIQMVIDGRLAREAEQREASATRSTTEADHEEQDTNMNDFDSAYDDLLAEFDDSTDKDHDHAAKYLPERDLVDEYPGDPGFYVGDSPEPEDDADDDAVFDPETLFEEMAQAAAAEKAANPPLFLGIPGIKDYVFDGHAGAGPSASERWMNCTMSLSASKRFLETLSPNQQRAYASGNTAARQGTTAHTAAEAEASHMLGRIDEPELQAILLGLMTEPDEGEEYSDEMGEYIVEYVDLFATYANERGADKILLEQRVGAAIPLADLHEGEVYIIRGAADGIALPTEEDPVLVVGDLKYGDGIWVEATANTQALIYALGVLDLLVDDEGNLITDITIVRLHIIQPRLGGIKTWEISLDDLLDWRDEVLSPALTKALYGEAEGATYNPSPNACQFCPARGGCPALAQQRMEDAAELFDVIQDAQFEDADALPDSASMSDEEIGNLLLQINGLVSLQKEMKAEVERRLHRGHVVPGFDLRNYSPPRKWKGEAAKTEALLIKRLGQERVEDLFTEPKLVTPAQAEKILGEEFAQVETLIEKPDKRPVVSTGPADRRSKWEGKAPEQMFDDEGADPVSGNRTAEGMFPDE